MHPCRMEQIDSVKINPSLVMMRECPCSTKTREVLGNPSPPPSRFPSTLKISLGLCVKFNGKITGINYMSSDYIRLFYHDKIVYKKSGWSKE